MAIDGGLPLGTLRDIVASAGEYLDFVKFGWGTAIVSGELGAKIELLNANGIDYYFGGTLFEKFVLQGRFDDFRLFCQRFSCQYVEASNGTIDLPHQEKAGYVRKLAADFTVISEVGFKDAEPIGPAEPAAMGRMCGRRPRGRARLVTLEARESASSGIFRANGELKEGLVDEVLAELPVEMLLFEAPTTDAQAYMLRRVGPDVNLGNIAPTAVLSLETLRLGLRADTLLDFEQLEELSFR